MCPRKEYIFFCFWIYVPYIFIKFIWYNVSFKASASLLIFCLYVLWCMCVVKVLYDCCVAANFSLYICYIFLMYLDDCLLYTYVFTIALSSSWTDPLIIMYGSTLSLLQSFFKLYFVRYKYLYYNFLLLSIYMEYNFFIPPFSDFVSLYLKWVSFMQHIIRSCFFTLLATPCLLSRVLFLLHLK